MSEYKYIDQDALVSALEDICGGSGVGLMVKEEMLHIARTFPASDVQEVIHTTNDCKINEHGWIFSTCHNCGNGGWCVEPDQKFCSKCGAMFDRIQWSETE